MIENLKKTFNLGFIVNPYAGMGGPSAHKGSDDLISSIGNDLDPSELRATKRAEIFLNALVELIRDSDIRLVIKTPHGAMGGEEILRRIKWPNNIDLHILTNTYGMPSRAEDTKALSKAILESSVDLLLFVGGDGTARDICSMVNTEQAVLGVPSGVKMHSGVFAITPLAAAQVTHQLMSGELTNVRLQEVRDIDEQAFRQGIVKSRFFGEMLVPEEGAFVQHVKQGGIESEPLVLNDMAEYIAQYLEPNTLLVVGPGSTTRGILENWNLEGTLLGIDLLLDNGFVVKDADAPTIYDICSQHEGPIKLMLTAIGGQGHIIGRGNQQLSSEVLKLIGEKNFIIVATKTKLKTLGTRPLIVDSGDLNLDAQISGYLPVICGYEDTVLYPVGHINDKR